jgi:predicted dehydrogenase
MAQYLNPFDFQGVDRRSFIRTSAVAGATLLTWRPTLGRGSVLKRVNVASIGVGGQGGRDLGQIAGHPETVIVALCDVDTNNLTDAATLHTNATTFTDYREMFDAMGDKIDAVVVSTPDHMHASIAMMALNNNKHVYCQKPLAHSISECRALRAAANAKPYLVTQMGTQNTARSMKRRAMKALEEGIVGRVIEIQALTDRAKGWWPQGNPRPEGSDPVPENLKWDLWLGVAPERPYKKDAYAPFKWRGVRDFGVGAIGDMGCHITDAAFQTFGLGDPTSVRCETVSNSNDEYPLQEVVKMILPGVEASGGEDIPFTWYDGGLKPNPSELGMPVDFQVPFNVVIVVGEKGTLMVPIPGDGTKFFRKGKERSIELPSAPNKNHWHMWVDAIQGKEKNYTPFDYASRVSETLAIGAVASNFPNETLEWDAKAMKFTNKPEAAKFVTRTYRDGWSTKNL